MIKRRHKMTFYSAIIPGKKNIFLNTGDKEIGPDIPQLVFSALISKALQSSEKYIYS